MGHESIHVLMNYLGIEQALQELTAYTFSVDQYSQLGMYDMAAGAQAALDKLWKTTSNPQVFYEYIPNIRQESLNFRSPVYSRTFNIMR